MFNCSMVLKNEKTGISLQELNLFRDINWKIGYPPPDEPKCGFYGEKCKHSFGEYARFYWVEINKTKP